jgi:hypothetical protein
MLTSISRMEDGYEILACLIYFGPQTADTLLKNLHLRPDNRTITQALLADHLTRLIRAGKVKCTSSKDDPTIWIYQSRCTMAEVYRA